MENCNENCLADQETMEKPDTLKDTRSEVTNLIENQGIWTMLPEEWANYARQKNIY